MLGVLLLQEIGAQYRVGNANAGQGKPIKCYNYNGIGHIARNCTQPKRPQNSNYFKEKILLMKAQENGVDLDEEQLLFLAGGQTNTFDDELINDAFDSDVDEAPIAQTMFMANLSSTDPVYDEAGPSYDSDTISKDNEDQVIHSDVSSVPNDAVMIITNDIYEQDATCVTSYMPNDAVNASLTVELAKYKELAEAYEKRAQFELTERELLIDTQMRMIIKDRNVKEESLQKELHSVKMQLNSTLNHNKLIREEVSTLKQDFKQKENKLLEEFMDMKHLKEKVEDKLYKQDQSLKTVYMLCKPKSFYDEINRVAIGYKNPFYLSKAKQVQPSLYNGHEIVKTNHARPLVHDSEDTLEIAETTRKQMIEKNEIPRLQGGGNTIRELKAKISRLQKKHSEADPILDCKALDSQNKDLNAKVNALQDLNERFRVENEKVKQHYKELYDSIKIKGKTKCVTMPDLVKPKILTPDMYAIDVEPIPPRSRNNREVRLEYLKHLKESIGTLCEIVEEARREKDSYCPLNKKKRVTFTEPGETSTNNSQTHVEQQKMKKTNEPMISSTGVKDATIASWSKPKSNTKKYRTLPAKSDMKKVEAYSRNNKSSVKQKNRVDSSISIKHTVINLNSTSVCQTCNKYLMSFNHDKCVVRSLKFVKKSPVNKVWRVKQVKQVWQATGKLLTDVGFQWQPTGRKFTLGEQCPLTRFTESKVVPATEPKSVSTSEIVITKRLSNTSQKPLTRYQRKNKQDCFSTDNPTTTVVQIVLWYLDSRCSKHMTEDRSRLRNFMKKFTGTVRFGNNHFSAIMGYGDYVIGGIVISRVYYIEGLGHNLFSVRQFCDSDLEVAFRKHSCYVRDVTVVDLIKGNYGSNLYTISVEYMMKSSPICLLSKALKNKS
ncbi:integrase, catalytic region, zinc finger, CCHC-type containing protein [Tanacetum coccineum]